jgi:hypothetical protein
MLIAGAAAQIAFQSVPYLGFCWIWVAVEDLCGGHHHSGCAIPTLQAVPLPKSFLNRMQIPVRGHAFDGRDVRPIGLHGKHRARFRRLPV